MLQRALAREGVDERPRALLDASGIRSYRQLVQRPLWDAAHAADLSVADMSAVVTKVSARLAPKSRTAFDMFLESVNRPMTLRTGLPVVDAALCGGLHAGPIHELAGSSGIGKTQWAMTLAVQCAIEYPNARVLYVDSEHGFSAKRVRQIARARLRGRLSSSSEGDGDVERLLQRILVQRVASLAVFLRCLKALDRDVPAQKIQLVIVDSIAALLVKAHELTFSQREHQIQRIASRLKYIGDVHRAFVVVTNRATTVENEFTSFTKPLLGETWAHCVTSRFVLERHAMFRAISVVKCPSSNHVVQPFELTELGLVAAEEPMLAHRDDALDDDFDIHDDVLRDLDLTGLPAVDPSGTLRSTQQSESSAVDHALDPEEDPEDKGVEPPTSAAALASDDFVSDSNDESDRSDAEDDGGGGALGWLAAARR